MKISRRQELRHAADVAAMRDGFAAIKARQQAAKLRRALADDAKPAERQALSPDEWIERDETGRLPQARPRRSPRPSELVAALAAVAGEPVDTEAAGRGVGLVIGLERGHCLVELDGQLLDCVLASAAPAARTGLAAGDEVALAFAPGGEPRIAARLPRRSCLSRPDPHAPQRERVIAANVDLAVLVVSVAEPPLRPRLVDRYLVAIARGGARPALAVNKLDLLASPADEEAALAPLAPYRALDLPLVLCSAATGRGMAELAALLAGRTAVLVGHSGVGKSSLVNALAPAVAAATAAVSGRGGKGRHTTTRSEVHPLPGGGRLIDTPGVREFGLWDIAPAELAVLFPDFAALGGTCRFGDCTHSHEPGCAVAAAVAEGRLAGARHATYLRLLASLSEQDG